VSVVSRDFCNDTILLIKGFVLFGESIGFASVNTLAVFDFVLLSCLYGLFVFSSKDEAQQDECGGVECHGVMAPRKSNNRQASHAVRGRGHGCEPTKIKADKVLLDVKAGASDGLPPLVKQSFKEGRYSPSTGMEEKEW
jgi:hypothetical protein